MKLGYVLMAMAAVAVLSSPAMAEEKKSNATGVAPAAAAAPAVSSAAKAPAEATPPSKPAFTLNGKPADEQKVFESQKVAIVKNMANAIEKLTANLACVKKATKREAMMSCIASPTPPQHGSPSPNELPKAPANGTPAGKKVGAAPAAPAPKK